MREMTFEDRFQQSIENFRNIEKPDFRSNQVTLFADFVELRTIFSNDEAQGFGDVQDSFFGQKNYKNARERDEDEKLIIEIFQILEERSILFEEDYPFVVLEGTKLTLKQDLSIKNKTYISLLISSMLNIFLEFKSTLSTEFEIICFEAFKNFLPQKSVVKHFGKHSAYIGNAITKIKALAKDLNLEIDEYELSQVNERNNQERGLDIVGWIPFHDRGQNQVIFLGQSACGKDYESKQHDTRRFENYLRFYKTEPQHVLFVPYSLINRRVNKFYHSDLIEKDYLVFERKRLIEFYSGNNFENLESCRLVNACISYKEPLV